MKINYVTGNKYKFDIIQNAFKNTNILFTQRKMETPEIQSKDVKEVAIYSAKWACESLKEPVIVTDAGFYIEALNGFPGPFIKYINEWFTENDFLNLMKDKKNRKIVVKDCLAFCDIPNNSIVFTGSYEGTLSYEPSKANGTPIEKLFIPLGFNKPIAQWSREDQLSYWSNSDILNQLKEYLTK